MTTIPADASRNAVSPSSASWFNPRLVVAALVLAALIGYPAVTLVQNLRSDGVVDAGDLKKVDLKKLGFFKFNPVTDTIAAVPAKFVALRGQKVALEGFPVTLDGGANYQLVYNVQICCLGGPPQVQERVFIVTNRKTRIDTPISDKVMVRCIGILHVNVDHDPETGLCNSVYTMEVQRIEPI